VKIILIHSYYRLRGGEDEVFEQEFELLKQTEDVRAITFRNLTGWRGAVQFLLSIWNISVAGKVKRIIFRFKPDIIQIYNWHYATGPIIIRVAKKLGVRVVINVPNYRLLCPSATLVHKGKLFTGSIDKRGFPWLAVQKKVYHNSFFQSFWMAFVVYFHKKLGTWHKVDLYIVPTGSVKKLFTENKSYLDLPPEKFAVKPNFSVNTVVLPAKRGSHFSFIGRLSEEKGIHVLLEAFKNSPHELVIAGSGPLSDMIRETCSGNSNIQYVGNLSKEGVKAALSASTALIFPSICFETFGLVITEAFSAGCPVIASDIGSPTELVREGVTGLLFKADDKNSLRNRLDFWKNLNEAGKEQYRKNCISTYENLYTPLKNRVQLLNIYQSVINNTSGMI
jgi:glycosyltransferase involved in cell wall biosynthesis